MIKMRLTYADDKELSKALEVIEKTFDVLNMSKTYKGRGNSKYNNIYIDVEVQDER